LFIQDVHAYVTLFTLLWHRNARRGLLSQTRNSIIWGSPSASDIRLMKKCSPVSNSKRFLTKFRETVHWALTWDSWFQSAPKNSVSLIYSLILSFHLRLCFQSYPFSSVSATKFCICFSSHMHPVWPEYLVLINLNVLTISAEAPHCVILSIPLLLHPLYLQILSTPRSQTPPLLYSLRVRWIFTPV